MAEPKSTTPKKKFNRKEFDELMRRRFFYINAFEIYGGVKGLYDYGPPGAAIKNNFLQFWRKWFVMEEDMLEIACTNLTPEVVLKASGHVEKFEDKMVREVGNKGEYLRADHLLEDKMDELLKNKKLTEEQRMVLLTVQAKADAYSLEELGQMLKKYKVKSPRGKPITDPIGFNLMFSTQIGPSGDFKGYMRPETAQGIFVNFKRLLDYNASKLPFAAAQLGNAFRNEISPRGGLLRVREFDLAEIEHFVDPRNKKHPKFASVADVVLPLYPTANQLGDKKLVHMTIGDAVKQGVVDNETLGYFLVRCHAFLTKVGIIPEKLRFRQHLPTEMAHYASDCWDAEILVSQGWVECVGNADRACFDLATHTLNSGKDLVAFVPFPDGKTVKKTLLKCEFNRKKIGMTLKAKAKPVMALIESAVAGDSQARFKKWKEDLDANGKVILGGEEVTKEMMSFSSYEKEVSGENIQPSVIEPSYGVSRIIYCIMEHAFWKRGDGQRFVLSLSPIVAPVKCSIIPLIRDERLSPFVTQLKKAMNEAFISAKVDDKGGAKIGRRYARTDEIGIPFGVTVDFTTVEDNTVTLRERDSMKQVRVPLAEIAMVVRNLCDGFLTWEKVAAKYPAVTAESKE